MPDTSARVAFLKQSHLFRGVNDKDLAAVAEIMQEAVYTQGRRFSPKAPRRIRSA